MHERFKELCDLSAFDFWNSLSGPSKNLFFDVAHGRRTKKPFATK